MSRVQKVVRSRLLPKQNLGILPYLYSSNKIFAKSDQEFSKLNTGAFITLFKTFGKFKKVDTLKSLHERIEKLKIPKSGELVHAMIGSAFESKQYDHVEKFIKMRQDVEPLNAKSYSVIIRGYCNSGEMEKATQWFDEMIEKFKFADEVVYFFFLNGYGKKGDYVNLEKTLGEIQKRFGSISPTAYHIVIRAVSLNDHKKAFDYFYRSIDEGKEPLIDSYNWLLLGFIRNKQMAEAEKFFVSLLKDGVRPTADTFNLMLKEYAKLKNVKSFDETLSTMKRVRVKANPGTYTLMLRSALQKDQNDKILSLLNEIKVNRMVPQVGYFIVAIKHLVQKGQLDLAEDVYNEIGVFDMICPQEALVELVSGFEKANKNDKVQFYKKMIQ